MRAVGRSGRALPALLAIAAFVFCGPAHARDWGEREGIIENAGTIPFYCYRDVHVPDHRICEMELLPGETCRADGAAARMGADVHKIPNQTAYRCEVAVVGGPIECRPADGYTMLTHEVVKFTSRAFGPMSWERFWFKMARNDRGIPLVSCGQDWVLADAASCASEQEFDSLMKDLAKAAEGVVHPWAP